VNPSRPGRDAPVEAEQDTIALSAMPRSIAGKSLAAAKPPGAFSVSIESKRGSRFLMARFLDANRFPLRLKTLSAGGMRQGGVDPPPPIA
jgi:hypothetical protein